MGAQAGGVGNASAPGPTGTRAHAGRLESGRVGTRARAGAGGSGNVNGCA